MFVLLAFILLIRTCLMTMEQWHSVQHISMRVDTGDWHGASKRVYNRHWSLQWKVVTKFPHL